MKLHRNGALRGFTLVELLAVVLVLAVLAAVAVPLYLNTRKSSAARTCKGNIAAISAAQSAYATRFGGYKADASGTSWTVAYTAATSAGVAPGGGLVGAPEGLASIPVCPLAGKSYKCLTTTTTGEVEIQCPDAAQHDKDTGGDGTNVAPWDLTLKPAGTDSTNPL